MPSLQSMSPELVPGGLSTYAICVEIWKQILKCMSHIRLSSARVVPRGVPCIGLSAELPMAANLILGLDIANVCTLNVLATFWTIRPACNMSMAHSCPVLDSRGMSADLVSWRSLCTIYHKGSKIYKKQNFLNLCSFMPYMVNSSQYADLKSLGHDQWFVGVLYMTKSKNTENNALDRKYK